MAVFVDTMRAPFQRMIMCHMFADTDEELHAMAAKIGVARKWHQRPASQGGQGMNASWSHYDICLSKKKKAMQFGAQEIEYKDLPKWLEERGRR